MSRQAANGQVPPLQPDPGPPKLERCWCGAAYLDDDESRHAHSVVFLHQPNTRESPPKETST